MAGNQALEQAPGAVSFHHDANKSTKIMELLGAEVAARFGPRNEQPLTITARDPAGVLTGGVNGVSHWRWLYIRHFFIAPTWRRQGLGRRLMEQAEAAAIARGCIGIYLDTFEESAAAFYKRCGFVRCGRIENFPLGTARIYLSKALPGTLTKQNAPSP